MYKNVDCSSTDTSQDLNTTQMSISRRMGKYIVYSIEGKWINCSDTQ